MNDRRSQPEDHDQRRRAEPQRRDRTEAVYVISVAAEIAGMHPQTLRSYERNGLVDPNRSSGNVRRYSERDIERLREIQYLTQEEGLNLAGVKMVLDMRDTLAAVRARAAELERRLDETMDRMQGEIEAAHASHRHELVPWQRGVIEVYRRSGRRPHEETP